MNVNIRKERGGVRLTMTASNGSQIDTMLTRSEVAQLVNALCQEASLPQPWTGR